MNWYKIALEIDNEMESWFRKRTKSHIELVQKYATKIEKYDNRFNGLIERTKKHDESKFSESERTPYIWTTWKYKCKDKGEKFKADKDMENRMTEATEHHVKNNRHHPEFGSKGQTINKEDRDSPPDKIVDGTWMEDLDIGEMCSDWMAMSEEKGTSPKTWADKNVNIRWKFDKDQVDLIYELIENVY